MFPRVLKHRPGRETAGTPGGIFPKSVGLILLVHLGIGRENVWEEIGLMSSLSFQSGPITFLHRGLSEPITA